MNLRMFLKIPLSLTMINYVMKSNSFYSLKDLIIDLGAPWDDTMIDVVPERYPLYYGSEDDVFTEDTHRRHLNHDTPESWLTRYSKRYYSQVHDQWLTMAHCMYGNKDKLIGTLATEEEKLRKKEWNENNPDKAKANHARYHAKPSNKEYQRALYASEWMISHDITLEGHDKRHESWSKMFKANTPYKWSTLIAYYRGSGATSAAIQDGWFKV